MEDSNTDASAEQQAKSAGSTASQIIDSTTALVKAIPIYDDAVQPVAKEIGKALGTVGKSVNLLLAPLSGLVWGYEQIQQFLESRVAEKLENVSEDLRQSPPLNVVGPAVQALKFSGDEETLREMFANLIANSIDTTTAKNVHPAFVEILKNLSSEEAKILKCFIQSNSYPLVDLRINIASHGFGEIYRNESVLGIKAGCIHAELTSSYLENLCRLGVLSIPEGHHLISNDEYVEVLSLPHIASTITQFQNNKTTNLQVIRKLIQVTKLGQQFIDTCVKDKNSVQ